MVDATRQDLLDILDQIEAFLSSPPRGNSYSQAVGHSAAKMAIRIRKLKRRVALGDPTVVGALSALFLPTGELQDLSIDSGWGDEYLTLAARYDALALQLVGSMTWRHWLILITFAAAAYVALVAFRHFT